MSRKALKSRCTVKKTPLWLLSFADVTTLMLCFLILLVGFSELNAKNTLQVVSSIDTQFRKTAKKINTDNLLSSYLQGAPLSVLKGFSQFLKHSGGAIRVKQIDNFQALSIGSTTLFRAGSATLTEKGVSLLDGLVPYLQRANLSFSIEGHTAPRQDEEGKAAPWQEFTALSPLWRLSFERAKTVYDHFSSRGIPQKTMTIKAYGEFQPEFDNYTPEGRKKNRRVDIIFQKNSRSFENAYPVPTGGEADNNLYYHGFKFDITLPENQETLPPKEQEESKTDSFQRRQGKETPISSKRIYSITRGATEDMQQ